MTLPATLSITSASIGLLAALLALGMSSAPGWRELRWFAVCASCAALFNLANAPITTDVSPRILALASRFNLFFGGLHAVSWIKYVAEHANRPLRRWERAWLVTGVAVSGLTLVPGLVVEDHVVARPVPWLHVSYVDSPPTTFGVALIAFYQLSVAMMFAREARRWLRGDVDARPSAIALGAVVLGAVHDGLASTDVIRSPYVLDLSLLVLVLSVGGSLTTRFVASARALVARSRDLEAAQQELVKKERLAALGELAAVVAHEVRNPLAIVFNATAGLRRAKPGSDDHVALVAIVQEEAERLRDIVSDLLEFARPRPAVLVSTPFGDLVRAAVETACRVTDGQEEDVAVAIAEGVGQVECDERLVRQAIVNLVTNALQTAERRAPVRIDVAEETGILAVRVVDDGGGVPPDLRDRIFTPFFSTRPTGTGLGLAVVRRCADAHGGEVVLRETPGGGATFELRLPRLKPEARAADR